jgi:hypothetical protein
MSQSTDKEFSKFADICVEIVQKTSEDESEELSVLYAQAYEEARRIASLLLQSYQEGLKDTMKDAESKILTSKSIDDSIPSLTAFIAAKVVDVHVYPALKETVANMLIVSTLLTVRTAGEVGKRLGLMRNSIVESQKSAPKRKPQYTKEERALVERFREFKKEGKQKSTNPQLAKRPGVA